MCVSPPPDDEMMLFLWILLLQETEDNQDLRDKLKDTEQRLQEVQTKRQNRLGAHSAAT